MDQATVGLLLIVPDAKSPEKPSALERMTYARGPLEVDLVPKEMLVIDDEPSGGTIFTSK
jgi:hypothetical protein